MMDVVFDLKGGFIPGDYAFPLWGEIARILPWLDAEELAGVVPLRGTASGEGMLLAQRTKLVLRLPAELAQQAGALSGRELGIGSATLQVGEGRERPLQAHPTLHAHLVQSAEEESIFLDDMAARLRRMEVACKWICGKRLTVQGPGQSLAGYSLVLHDLKPDASLLVQRAGLGGNRRFGCGIFVPYKAISGLD